MTFEVSKNLEGLKIPPNKTARGAIFGLFGFLRISFFGIYRLVGLFFKVPRRFNQNRTDQLNKRKIYVGSVSFASKSLFQKLFQI